MVLVSGLRADSGRLRGPRNMALQAATLSASREEQEQVDWLRHLIEVLYRRSLISGSWPGRLATAHLLAGPPTAIAIQEGGGPSPWITRTPDN